jgi:hypothetical protein
LSGGVAGRGLLGVLLMQDVLLGIVVAMFPMLASFNDVRWAAEGCRCRKRHPSLTFCIR